METFNGRLHSFDKPKGKSSNKSSNRTWPHPGSFVATPTTLAEAGFFFKPSKDNPDNVQCFICKKELGGWDEDDNPFEIHCKKCPKCPWAIARCSLEFDVDENGKFSLTDPSRLPTNKVLEKARTDTFGGKKWWPHDGVKNHGATSKKMAKAGFVYTPQAQGDDTATCFYCNLSLSGWDAEDDPTDEHIKRVEKSGKLCPFFQSTERPKSQASTRSTKSAVRKSRAPNHVDTATDEDEDESPTVKAPAKRGRQKENRSEKPMKPPSKLSDAEDTEDLEEDDDPSLKAQPAHVPRKSSRKPASKSKPPPKASGRSKQRSKPPSEDPDEIVSEPEVKSKPVRPRAKSGKSKSKGHDEEARESEREVDKPPSNVDGKVAKPYTDFTVDINAVEEARDKDKARGRSKGKRGRSTAPKGRSRSKSKPRSTGASTLFDPHEKPLLRASSRVRASGLTEMEEMETEKMLAETPSETDVELEPEPEALKEPPRVVGPKGRMKVPEGSDVESVVERPSRPSSRPASVVSEKSTSSKASKRGKVSAKKAPTKARDNKVDSTLTSSKRHGQFNSEAEEEPDSMAEDHLMEVDADDQGMQGQDYGEATPRAAPPAKQPAFPAPASPSDFRFAPSKPAKQGKPVSKLNLDRDGSATMLDPKKTVMQFEESDRARSSSAKTGELASEKTPSVPKKLGKQPSRMDVDDDRNAHSGSRSQERMEQPLVSDPAPQVPIDSGIASPPHTPERASKAPPHPTTPENQIIRNGHLLKPPANASDFQNSLQVPPSPAGLFLPPLANAPIPVINALTEEERNMTVEQWIRHEMAIQYQRLKEDGERRIRAFLEKAEETRRQIEAL